MNFEKIDIYGFKSFADKVEIKFEDGITAIVGPNGCGKSNIADAIRFVMGEQSAKSMRGASMPDVIFNGTEKRKAQSYCEVSLYFNNKDRIFKLDYDEVVLTRKLYKNGESEYLVNKNVCRKKDIVDAFRDIGLGKESYCVIGQGKIDSLLSAKPEDRRNVFEEAAGISKFKEDKKKSENKLENVNENLTRISDIIGELERQLGPLKTQAENAKIFLDLSNKLKDLEVNLYVYEYENSNSEKAKIFEQIKSIEEEINLRQSELDDAVKKYEKSQTEITNLDDNIGSLRDELLDLTVELEKQNGELKLKNEKISILEEQNEKLLSSHEQCNFVVDLNKKELEKISTKKDELLKKIGEQETEQKKLENAYKLTLERLNIGEADALSFESELYSTLEQSGDVKSMLFKYQSELESLKMRLDEENESFDKIEEAIRSLEGKLKLTNEDIEKINKKIDSENGNKNFVIEKINDLNQKIADREDKLEEKKAEFHAKTSRLGVLSEMKEYNEGYAVSVKRVLQQAQDGSTIGGKVVGVVANLMSVPEKFEVAIEMALGASVQNIVTKNEEDAKAIIEYLKNNKFGRVTFLPISGVKSRSITPLVASKLGLRGVLGVASKLISFDKKYEAVFESLLGSTIIVDTLDNAIVFARETQTQNKIVTLDGDIISPQGSMTGGSRKEGTANLIGRDREIAELQVALEKLKNSIDLETGEISALKDKVGEYNVEMNAKIDEIHSLEMEKAKQEENNDAIEEQIDDEQEKLADLDISKTALLDKIDFVEKKLEQIETEMENVDSRKSTAKESKKQATDNFEKLRAERDEIFEKLSDLKVGLEADKAELKHVESELERVSVLIAENEFKAKENLLEIQKNNQEIASLKDFASAIMQTSEFSVSARKIDLVKGKIAELGEEKKTKQQEMNEADSVKMFLAGEIQRASDKKAKEENKIVKIDTDLDNLQTRVWEEYEMTYGDAKKLSREDFDAKSGREETAEIKRKIQKLGTVNLAAIEDIKTISDRYDDLSRQRDDMVKAKEDLNKIIDDLTKKMEIKFKDCFEQIRTNFQGIFRELFCGGKADIFLNDEKNVLDCGVDIIAEPPGKKLQSITLLSGGEKALTAVAILFSILKLRTMPFCVLDEIEAALDDTNVVRYARYLHRYTGKTQFIVITHRKPTMELADALYGVTMEEKGVSKVVSVKFSEAIEIDDQAI